MDIRYITGHFEHKSDHKIGNKMAQRIDFLNKQFYTHQKLVSFPEAKTGSLCITDLR
jgi:hypothetical protein